MVTGYNERLRLRATAESNQTNYPLKLTIAKGSGDNTASTIYLNNKALAWPNDIRFTNEAGVELSFWREESDATDGTWWVQADSLTANEIAYIYLHYGKAGDSDADSGPDGIVTFYDDFETGDLSKWTSVGTDWTAQDTTKYEGNYAAQSIGSSMSYNLYKDIAPGCSVAIEAKVRVNKAIHQFNPFKLTLGTHSLNALFLNAGNFDYKLSTHLPDFPRYDINTWYPIKIIIDNASQVLRWEISGAWNVDADPYTEQVALVDDSGNAIGASDFLTRIAADWHTASDSDDYGYIDYFIIYPYGGAKWLSPETTETLEDGFYVVERITDTSLKPEETLRVYAYNDYSLQFRPTRPTYDDFLDTFGYASLLESGTKNGVSAHYNDGWITCLVENSYDDDEKTIVDITVSALVSGRGRTILEYNGSYYYGTLCTKRHVASWIETVYTTKPGTSDAWTFATIGNLQEVGVDIRKTSTTTFPIRWDVSPGTVFDYWDEWLTDDSMYSLDSICYSVKLKVHYYLDSDPNTILEYDVPYHSIYDYSNVGLGVVGGVSIRDLSVFHQNIINNGGLFGYPKFVIMSDVDNMPTHTYYVFKKFQPAYLGYEDGGSVSVQYTVVDDSDYWNWESVPFIKIGGVIYYGGSYYTGDRVSYTYTWATNPATEAAWAEGDLGEEDGCGIEINDIYTSSPPGNQYWVNPYLSVLNPIITSSDSTNYISYYGDLECTPALWHVTSADMRHLGEYYNCNDYDYCNLIGDMYCYDGLYITTTELLKRYESDLSEIPPSFSQVTGFTVTASVFGWSDNFNWKIYEGYSSGVGTLNGDGLPPVSFLCKVTLTGTDCIGTVTINSEVLTFSGAGTLTTATLLSALPTITCTNLNCYVVVDAVTTTGSAIPKPANPTLPPYWRIFINIDGTRYYSDKYTLVGNPGLEKTQACSWDINPATSAAWTYDDFQGIKYGVEVTRHDAYDLVIFRPYSLYADIDYQAIVGPKAVIYHQVPAIDSTVSITKNSNTPKFKADELRCTLPVGYYLPERTEVVYYVEGSQVFHGFIWQADQRSNKETKILGKAMSHALACRYIPNFFYHARNSRWTSVYTIADLFSDDVPIYPNQENWMIYDCGNTAYIRNYDLGGDTTTQGVNPAIYMLWGTYSNIGLFFILNSMLPYGYAGENGYYRDVAGLSYNRAKFLMSHNPSVIPKVENVGNCIIDTPTWSGIPGWTEIVIHSDTEPTNVHDWVGAVKRFRQGAIADLSVDEYAYSGNDLAINHYPGVFMVLLDHALDTFIRPGRFDLEDKFLAVPYVFDGAYSDAFSDFFSRLGQEVRFRNSSNGYVYMDVASELGNAASMEFLDGKNATVTKSVRDPQPNAVLGNEFQPGLSTDWLPARTWLTLIEPTQRSGEDLQEWLDLRRDEDKSTWTVKTQRKLWHIQPGDYVYAQAHGQGLENVRIRKAVITNAGTTLTCGKRISDLSEEWGQWRSVNGSTDADTDMPVQDQAIDLGDCDGSQTFVIKAEEYEIGSWKCKLTVDWSLDVDEGYTADIASAPLGMFLVVQVNSKVVPPGRILSKGNSGSVEIDITEFCTCSTSADQTNTVALKLWRGVTSTHYRHKISGNITQYRRLEAVDNA